MITAIAAMDENHLIGRGGGLPWPSIKEDFKWFKSFTEGKYLVVGATTYKTLPPLPGRKLLVLTSSFNDAWFNPWKDTAMCTVGLHNVLDIAQKREVVVIGGAKTYEVFMDFIEEFYITHVNGSYEGDTYMPKLSESFNATSIVSILEGGHRILRYQKI